VALFIGVTQMRFATFA